MKYWLFKSEESVFNICDLLKSPKKTTCWEGVRNYQARNFLRDEIEKGDMVFFYHSNCETPGIAGTAVVTKEGYPDSYAWNDRSNYFDVKSNYKKPIWYMVDIRLKRKFKNIIPLSELRKQTKLKDMKILQKGSRLSVTPVAKEEWSFILTLKR